MPFELPSDISALVEAVRAFSAEHLAPGALERSKDERFPRDVSQLLAGRGWSGIASSKGAGGGILPTVAALEAVARACPRSGDAFHQLNFGASLLLARHADNDRQRAVLQDMAEGRALDRDHRGQRRRPAAATQTAVSGGMLRGHKAYCSNSAEADAFVVYAISAR